MELTKKYIDFMLDNVIGSNIRVQLPNPQEDGKLFWTKLGPTVYMNVELEVIEKYTRSVKFNLKFDRYEVEKIIFIPIESSPMSIKEKLYNTIENLVSKTFIGDGRQEEMRQMYEEKRKTMFSGLEKMIGKIKEIDEYGDLYENYKTKTEIMMGHGFHGKLLLKDEFIEKLKTDDEFNKTWGGMRKNILSNDRFALGVKKYGYDSDFRKEYQSMTAQLRHHELDEFFDKWKVPNKTEE